LIHSWLLFSASCSSADSRTNTGTSTATPSMPSHNDLKAALSIYPSALRLKADSTKSSQDLVELDKWYRGELRETLAKRREENEKDEAFFTVEEVGKLMKWKLAVRSLFLYGYSPVLYITESTLTVIRSFSSAANGVLASNNSPFPTPTRQFALQPPPLPPPPYPVSPLSKSSRH
jgi:hypothetical protein